MKNIFTLLLVFFLALNSYSQETPNTIDNQFKTIFKKSESYLDYKIILKKEYTSIHNNVLDSLKRINTELDTKNTLIKTQKNTIAALEKDKKESNTKLNDITKENTTFSFFGIQLSKGVYSFILITIISILIIVVAYFAFKFYNSNILTSAAKDNLIDAENELNVYRKKALEREQKLRRQLQDEIIKNRGN